ncbi:MAG: glycosyl hydrolase, partial [Armatimonadota bacterium]|nr:glycosyl hydrolase [Armatimonadota bacterium]
DYEKRGKLDELWSLYNKLAVEVKKQYPGAKIGGPALTWAKPEWVEGFLKNCAANADFISWHNYGTGDIFETNEILFGKAPTIAGYARGVKEAVARYAPGRNMETFLSEFNVKWTWDPYERRHENNVGAVFMASTLRRVALTGITGVAHWHVKGNAYGMISGDNTLRAPAHLYRWGTHYLVGEIPAHSSDDEQSLELLPIRRTDGTRSLLLINKANRTVIVPGGGALLPVREGQRARLLRIDATTVHPSHTAPLEVKPQANGDLALLGYSLTLVTTALDK